MKYRYKTKPFKHQHRALQRAIRQGHYGALWEPGTGKTKLVVDWASALFLGNKLKRLLIFAPFSVLGVWEDEFATHCPVKYRIYVLDKKDTAPPRDVKGALTVLVVGYDLGWRRDKLLLNKYKPQMVIADESHKCKKPSARRARFLRRFNRVPYRGILTGTPNPKSYVDLYAQWVFLNPKQFGTNVDNFKDEYVRYGGYMKKQVRGYRNVHTLLRKVRTDAGVILKADCLDLPPVITQRVPVMLEPEAWVAYRKMAIELFLELKKGDISDAKNVAVKILRLQQITGGWIKSDEGNLHVVSRAKLRSAVERMEDVLNADEGLVIFARFRPEVRALAQLGTKLGVPTHMLIGGVGRAERDEARRKFQAQKGGRLFIAQIQTGGLGITLHSASEGLFYSVTYALDDFVQAQARLDRAGQTAERVRFQHLVATSTIDVDIYSALKIKQDLMSTIMGSRKAQKKLMHSLSQQLEID